MLLSAGSAPLPVTQSALNQTVYPVMPLNAFVSGQGFEALAVVGMTIQILRKMATEISFAIR